MSRKSKGSKPPPRVFRHVQQQNPDEVRLVQSHVNVPRGNIFIPRLATWWVPPQPFDAAKIASNIESRQNVFYFCDSTQFIAPTHPLIWKALLSDRRIVMTPPVFQELKWWLREPTENHEVHKHIKASLAGDDSAPIVWMGLRTPDLVNVCEYYVNLLGMRKSWLDYCRIELEEQLGRLPSKQEISNYCQQLGTSRAQLLGRQGENTKLPAHRFNDECLVVMAILFAVTTGREVTIISSDEAVLDQFYKAVWLIDTHYRSMLMADRYAEDRFAFPIQRAFNPSKEAFADDEVVLMRKPSADLHEVLPRQYNSVVVNCLLIQSEVTQSTFCAEREMERLFKIKSRTGGMNTDRFDGKNFHIFMGDMAVKKLGNWAVLASDCVIPLPERTLKLSVVDINLAMLSDEHLIRLRMVDPNTLLLP